MDIQEEKDAYITIKKMEIDEELQRRAGYIIRNILIVKNTQNIK